MNEIIGGGVANEWFGGASWSGGGREGVSLPETSQEFQNNLCCGVERFLFQPPRVSGFLWADRQEGCDKAAPFQSLLSINLPRHTSPNLRDLCH